MLFFLQAEDGIRDGTDWSSDVCSSDLTLTDGAGTSTTQVFTGRVVSRNGGPQAAISKPVAVPAVAPGLFVADTTSNAITRSEERRVGKECKYRWLAEQYIKNQQRCFVR